MEHNGAGVAGAQGTVRSVRGKRKRAATWPCSPAGAVALPSFPEGLSEALREQECRRQGCSESGSCPGPAQEELMYGREERVLAQPCPHAEGGLLFQQM